MPVNFLLFTIINFAWLAGCIALGILYAWMLYPLKKGSSQYAITLFCIRTVVVALISWLLIAPEIKLSGKILEKPIIVIAQDNSASIGISQPSNFDRKRYQEDLTSLRNALAKVYEVKTFSFSKTIEDSLKFGFDGKQTNTSEIFKVIRDRFGNRNIGALVLATDGIYNTGPNPLYESKENSAPVFTIALGDTVPKKDLLLSNTAYNNNVFLGNKFVIEIDVEAWQSNGASTELTVTGSSGNEFKKQIFISSGKFRQTIPVTLSAKVKGIQKYTISLRPIAGELSTQNNTRVIFVDVIDGRQNIAIVAAAPHPDISAIRQSIAENKNYSSEVTYTDNLNQGLIDKANMLVLYQVPSIKSNQNPKTADLKPILYVLGTSTHIGRFSASQDVLQISAGGGFEETFGLVNNAFYAFTLTDSTKTKIGNFAPLQSAFGNYQLSGQAQILLKQRIRGVETGNPLLVFGQSAGRKIGILAGEGIWRWRLEDFQENGSHGAVNELLSKSIQYLSSKDDQKKFRAYPAQRSYDESERIIFNGELYSDSYELVNTSDVRLNVESDGGKKYSFLFSRKGSSYSLDAGELPAGEYSYIASTNYGERKYSDRGRFIVSSQDVEYRQTTADHQLLNTISSQSGGKMVYPNQISDLIKLINENEKVKTISYEDNKYRDLVDFKWIFLLILGLLSLEWFSRKREGLI